MQVITNIPLPYPGCTDKPDDLSASKSAGTGAVAERCTRAIWPDYFARRGERDATRWHYKGYWRDTRRIWGKYYGFLLRHPIIALTGQRQFYRSLAYRAFGQAAGDRSNLLISALTPLLLLAGPVLALAAVAVAKSPPGKKRVPPLFAPFSLSGWTNYCVMLILVFSLHGFRQSRLKLHPARLSRDSSKQFWNEFFTQNLPPGHCATQITACCKGGLLRGYLPQADLIVKPMSAGAGHKLRSMRWDEGRSKFVCKDIERAEHEAREYTHAELQDYIASAGIDMVVEKLERARTPFPVCSIRVLTLHISGNAELVCAAFLPAPEQSVSTAYFDLDTYMLDLRENRIGAPLRPESDGRMRGIALPELPAIIETCLRMHDRLSEHTQISWDIIPTARGPVYLEGNVFPPGCDYKLTLFKNDRNFDYLVERIIAATQDHNTPAHGSMTCAS